MDNLDKIVTINVTKIFSSNPKLITWINKSPTSNPKQMETTSVNKMYYITLETPDESP